MIEAAQNQKQTETGGLAKSLLLKIGAKVMLTVNINIQDGLINGQVGEVEHMVLQNNTAKKLYVNFLDPSAALKATAKSYLSKQNSRVAIEKCELEIPIKKGSSSPCIKKTRFPLTLAWVATVHKVQGLSLDTGAISFDFQKQKAFGQCQIYVALSKVKSYHKLFCIRTFKKTSIKTNVDALNECELSMFDSIKKNLFSDDVFTILVVNV